MASHVASLKLYLIVFAALMVLLVATVAAAELRFERIDVGPVNLGFVSVLVMLTIAIAKAVLVVLYFMHVRWSSRLTWVFVVSGVLWLGILAALTLSDYLSRGWFENDSVFQRVERFGP